MSAARRLRASLRSDALTRIALVALTAVFAAACVASLLPQGALRSICFGARYTLIVGLSASLVAVSLGSLLGASAALSGSVWDRLVAHAVEVLGAFPGIIIVALLRAIAPDANLVVSILALALVRLPESIRVVRAETLRLHVSEFALAARALGVPSSRFLWRHLGPHLLPFVAESAVLTLGVTILFDGALALFGLSHPDGPASWGSMIARSVSASRPQDALLPATLVLASVFALVRLSETVRRSLDPRPQSTSPLRDGPTGSR